MSKVGAFVGLLGIIAVTAAALYATSKADVVTTAAVRNVAPPAERVRVEVLNAGGVAGLARAATLELRDIGFDVVHYGNANTFDRDSSAVVDRVGRPELARAVADALGLDGVVSDPDPDLFVDVTVLLGKEWGDPRASQVEEDSLPEREPWDPRGWIGR
jgi:hypothetical protein